MVSAKLPVPMSKKSCPVRRTCEYLMRVSNATSSATASDIEMSGLTWNCAVYGPDPNTFLIVTSLKYFPVN